MPLRPSPPESSDRALAFLWLNANWWDGDTKEVDLEFGKICRVLKHIEQNVGKLNLEFAKVL